jgi:hypothetical protein
VSVSRFLGSMGGLYLLVCADPIAMSVRSTNVYEEKSLGVFGDDDESIDEETLTITGPPVTVWSRYLAFHIRKQFSFCH